MRTASGEHKLTSVCITFSAALCSGVFLLSSASAFIASLHSAAMHCPNTLNDLLMLIPSSSPWPSVFAVAVFSEPARSMSWRMGG